MNWNYYFLNSCFQNRTYLYSPIFCLYSSIESKGTYSKDNIRLVEITPAISNKVMVATANVNNKCLLIIIILAIITEETKWKIERKADS